MKREKKEKKKERKRGKRKKDLVHLSANIVASSSDAGSWLWVVELHKGAFSGLSGTDSSRSVRNQFKSALACQSRNVVSRIAETHIEWAEKNTCHCVVFLLRLLLRRPTIGLPQCTKPENGCLRPSCGSNDDGLWGGGCRILRGFCLIGRDWIQIAK